MDNSFLFPIDCTKDVTIAVRNAMPAGGDPTQWRTVSTILSHDIPPAPLENPPANNSVSFTIQHANLDGALTNLNLIARVATQDASASDIMLCVKQGGVAVAGIKIDPNTLVHSPAPPDGNGEILAKANVANGDQGSFPIGLFCK